MAASPVLSVTNVRVVCYRVEPTAGQAMCAVPRKRKFPERCGSSKPSTPNRISNPSEPFRLAEACDWTSLADQITAARKDGDHHDGLKPGGESNGRSTTPRRRHGEAPAANSNSFNADFIDLITRHAWADIWTRPHFDERTRRVLVIGTLPGLCQWDEFRLHVRAA